MKKGQLISEESDIVIGDFVVIENVIDHDNKIGHECYFIVDYDHEGCCVILIPFTDETYSTPLYINGKIIASKVYEFGIDAIEKYVPYE